MAEKIGLEMYLYRNSNTYASPTWVEVTNVKDLSFNLEKTRADMTTRANAGWRSQRGTLKDGGITFQSVYDTADADYTAFESAWFDNTAIEFALADGDISTTGTKYIRMTTEINNLSRTENLEEGVMVDIEANPSPVAASEAPSQVTVP